jgi:hypothetical protein
MFSADSIGLPADDTRNFWRSCFIRINPTLSSPYFSLELYLGGIRQAGFEHLDNDQPDHYHLMFNMGVLGMGKGVELVYRLLDF